MESFITDMKAVLIMGILVVMKGFAHWLVGSIFLILNLEDLVQIKAFAEILVWFAGSILCLVYLAFRASEMIVRFKKSRIDKQIAEIKKRRINESN